MVEGLCAAVVVLQQHLVRIRDLTGVKARLHFQELCEDESIFKHKNGLVLVFFF